jgi:glycosyltransferase involved in cell wall biosynthesis
MTGEVSRLLFVVQRYGREVLGGGERLCREVALRLSGRYRVTVLTTCALDYLTWKDHYPAGESADGEVRLVRVPVVKERKVRSFGRLSETLYRKPHSLSDEAEWMERQGPDAPGIPAFIEAERGSHDLFVFFTYLYPPTFYGLPLVADRALLVPMAHPEEPLRLSIFRYLFGLPRGFVFNTPEERDLVHRTFGTGWKPDTVAGVGVELPGAVIPHSSDAPYLLFTGRLDVQKGLDELFDFFTRYVAERPGLRLRLLLAGERKMKLPSHPAIAHLGYVSEEDKQRLLAGCRAAVVPSPHESLSISALEAWAHGKPVLANGRSDVLRGQCRRSGGGFTYRDYGEFAAALDRVTASPDLAAALGEQGHAFVASEYTWQAVEGRWTAFLDRMLAEVHPA